MKDSSPSSYQNYMADDGNQVGTPKEQKACPTFKIVLGAFLLSAITFVIIDFCTNKYIAAGFKEFLEWIESNLVVGVFAFVLVYSVAIVLFVPGSILTLGSGFVFGKTLGLGRGVALATSVVFVGAFIGAIISFLLGRYLMRDWVGRNLVAKYPIAKALDKAFEKKGMRIFILLRLSPSIPFNAIDYIGGVTSIKLSYYALATCFILPGTLLYCFIGASAGSLSETENASGGQVEIICVALGIVFGVLALFVMSYYAKKEFNEIMAEQESQISHSGSLEIRDDPQRQGDVSAELPVQIT